MQMEVVHIVDVIMGKSDGGKKGGKSLQLCPYFPATPLSQYDEYHK